MEASFAEAMDIAGALKRVRLGTFRIVTSITRIGVPGVGGPCRLSEDSDVPWRRRRSGPGAAEPTR